MATLQQERRPISTAAISTRPVRLGYAFGHPLGATGVRLALTLARELERAQLRYGITSACIGGGQGIALLIENPQAATTSSIRKN